ncbi:MAG: hypothetical protein IPM29_02505 [Planctomycetes bacterium]|nr:hypothetical protein [Planctomycetota bacterium]
MRFLPYLSVASLLMVAPVVAQLPDWVTLPSTNPTRLWAESSIVVVQDAGGYHVYSSYTRTWSHLQVSANAAFHGFDDHVVIVDGGTAWGYATRRAVWSQLTLGGTPIVATPSSGAVWVTTLLDGRNAHVFSGLLGTWTTVPFASTPSVAIGRMVAVLSDGAKTVAVSAHFGEAVELGIAGATQLDAVGYCGIVRDTGYYRVFSAYRNTWRSIPASAQALLLKPPSRAGYVIVREPTSLNFYSALTDNQVLLYHGSAQVQLTTEADVAVVQDGNTLIAYSCATGTLDTVTTPNAWMAVNVRQEIIVADDGGSVYAFGLLEGRFAPALPGFTVDADTGAALAVELPSGDYHAFSCMTNSWERAPAGNYTATFVTYNGAILVDASGTLQGFSANRGTWTTQHAPVADSYYDHKAAFCARSGNRLDTFNGRTGQWATVTTAAQATVTCFDMSVIALDGQFAYCYSCYSDDWSSQACAATRSQLRDECAWCYDGTTVNVWSGSSQVSEWANIPEYWRILARGGRLHYDVAAEPGAAAILAIGANLANIPTPFGTLRIDPSAIVFVPLTIPAMGTASLSVTVPDLPSLRGVTLFAQGIFTNPNSRSIYLSGYFESTIM